MWTWYLYVVECADGTLYTGITNNVSRRLHEHNNTKKGAKYTRVRRPVRLVWEKQYNNRSEAQAAEYQFKKLLHKQKWDIIKGEINEQAR